MITIELTDESQFPSIDAELYNDDITLNIRGTVTISKPVNLFGSHKILFNGIGAYARFKFTWGFTSWSNAIAGNGFALNTGDAVFRKIKFFNYEGNGSAIKWHGKGCLTIDQCSFDSIANNVEPFKINPPGTADNVWLTQCIGGYGVGKGSKIIVKQCKFYNCCTDNAIWNHCIYVGPEYCLVEGCEFKQCGSPLSLGGYTHAEYVEHHYVLNNKFMNQVYGQSYDQTAPKVKAPIIYGGGDSKIWFLGNYISGDIAQPYFTKAYDDPSKFEINMNTYDNVVINNGMCHSYVLGRPVTKDEWLAKGFDVGSIWN